MEGDGYIIGWKKMDIPNDRVLKNSNNYTIIFWRTKLCTVVSNIEWKKVEINEKKTIFNTNNDHLEKSNNPENYKKGDPLSFLKIQFLKKYIKKLNEGPFADI